MVEMLISYIFKSIMGCSNCLQNWRKLGFSLFLYTAHLDFIISISVTSPMIKHCKKLVVKAKSYITKM